jgi:hypothetical protein
VGAGRSLADDAKSLAAQGVSLDNLQLKQVPITNGMLVRKPVADVFEAFVKPDITTKFWFTKSSGRLPKVLVADRYPKGIEEH